MDPCPDCGADAWTFDARRDEWACDVCGLVKEAHTVQPPAAPKEPVRTVPKRRVSRVREHTMDGSTHRFLEAREEARRLAGVLGCPPDVADRAGRMILQARKKGLTQGRRLDAVAAASLLASCRMLFLTRTSADIAAASHASEDQVQAAYKAITTGLKLAVPPMSAHEYLGQAASKAGLPLSVEAEARQILQPVCGTGRAAGKNPLGWAAAGLLVAARNQGHKVSVRKMAQAVGISDSTLAARVKDLES